MKDEIISHRIGIQITDGSCIWINSDKPKPFHPSWCLVDDVFSRIIMPPIPTCNVTVGFFFTSTKHATAIVIIISQAHVHCKLASYVQLLYFVSS